MAVGVVARRQRAPEPPVDLAASRVAGLPDADRLEVGKGRLGIADALDDRDLALVPQALDAGEVVVEAELGVDGQRLRDHRPGQLRPQVVQRRVRQRHQGAQSVVAAGELDHDQDVVVADPFLLGRVDRTSERVRHGRVAGGQAGCPGAEDQARLQEVAALELVDADFFLHRSRTYLS